MFWVRTCDTSNLFHGRNIFMVLRTIFLDMLKGMQRKSKETTHPCCQSGVYAVCQKQLRVLSRNFLGGQIGKSELSQDWLKVLI